MPSYYDGGVMRTRAKATGLGTRLAYLRRAAGLSQEDAAAKAGLATSTLARAERDRQALRYDSLARLARAYGVSMPDLFVLPGGSEGEKEALVQQVADILRRRNPGEIKLAYRLLCTLFDYEPPPKRVRKTKD